MKKQHLSISDASTIVFSLVRNDILKTLDEKYSEAKRSGEEFSVPKRQLRQLEIIYGGALHKAIAILKEKRIKICTECSSNEANSKFQQFKVYGSGNKIYHLAENSYTCQCPAFKEQFFAKSERFQCKHLLAIALLKYFDTDLATKP